MFSLVIKFELGSDSSVKFLYFSAKYISVNQLKVVISDGDIQW